MGCGCGRKRATEADPLIFGEPTGETYRVTPTITLVGVRRGETTWVKGTAVPSMIESGWFAPA